MGTETFLILLLIEDEYRNSAYQLKGDLFRAAAEGTHEYDSNLKVVDEYESRDLVSNILAGILLFVITIMVVVAVFYVCVSHEKSWLHSAVEKWAPNMNWTAEDNDDNNNDNNCLYSSDPTQDEDIISNISLSSSVEFEDEIELCNVKKSRRRRNISYNVNRHYSQQLSKEDTISSLERVDNNMGYCEQPPTKWNGSMQSTQSPSPGDDMLMRDRRGVNQSLLSNPFGDDKIGILKEEEMDMTPESKFNDMDMRMQMESRGSIEMDRTGSDSNSKGSKEDNINSSSADVVYKESSPSGTIGSRSSSNYNGNHNNNGRNDTVIIKREQHGSMEFDRRSRRSSTTSSQTNDDGMTILSNYEEYQNKMFPISESGGSCGDNDNDNSDGTNYTVSTHGTNTSRLTANVINQVRYNGNAGYYE